MGIVADQQSGLTKSAQAYFEPQLRELGLSRDQIEEQTVSELEASLERVNTAIAHPESFGVFAVKMTAKVGFVLVPPTEASLTIGVLPTLLERKSLILARLAELRGNQGISTLRDLIEHSVPDASVRARFEVELAELDGTIKRP